MFKIEGTTISLTRGDRCTITLKVHPKESENEEFIFHTGDKVSFGVYGKKELEKPPILFKEILVDEPTNILNICLESSDTKVGPMLNKPIEYWYEIQLNYYQTIVGYDESGPKLFILYPEGEVSDESGNN